MKDQCDETLFKQWANIRFRQQFVTDALHVLQIEHGFRQCVGQKRMGITGEGLCWDIQLGHCHHLWCSYEDALQLPRHTKNVAAV
jgi:hypothetical protein